MAYNVDLRKKAISLVERRKPNEEVAELLEIGIATLYKKEGRWRKLKIRKIDPRVPENI